MPDHSFECGDILRCNSKYYSEQLNIVGRSGIVMGTKPHHIHLWFPDLKRSFWIAYDILRVDEEPELSPFVERIQTLVYFVKAEEWELEETAEIYRLICYVDELPFETLLEIRAFLDIHYHSMKLAPEGMGRVICQIEWQK
jgi:hypothetical protein